MTMSSLSKVQQLLVRNTGHHLLTFLTFPPAHSKYKNEKNMLMKTARPVLRTLSTNHEIKAHFEHFQARQTLHLRLETCPDREWEYDFQSIFAAGKVCHQLKTPYNILSLVKMKKMNIKDILFEG